MLCRFSEALSGTPRSCNIQVPSNSLRNPPQDAVFERKIIGGAAVQQLPYGGWTSLTHLCSQQTSLRFYQSTRCVRGYCDTVSSNHRE